MRVKVLLRRTIGIEIEIEAKSLADARRYIQSIPPEDRVLLGNIASDTVVISRIEPIGN